MTLTASEMPALTITTPMAATAAADKHALFAGTQSFAELATQLTNKITVTVEALTTQTKE